MEENDIFSLSECDCAVDDDCLFSEAYVENFSIIEALDHVQEAARNSKLSDDLWIECADEVDFLCKRLDLNYIQVMLVAIMSEIGDVVSWRRIADFLGMSRLKAMTLTPDIDDLCDKRWVMPCVARERGGNYDGFKFVSGVIKAFRHNKKFVPEKLDGLSEQVFVDRLTRYICEEGRDCNISHEENNRWMLQLVEMNQHLPLCKKIMSFEEEISKIVLLQVIADYAQYGGRDCEGLNLAQLTDWFEDGVEFMMSAEEFKDGTQELFSLDIIEHGCQDGMADTQIYVLTTNAKNDLLGDFVPHSPKRRRVKISEREVLRHKNIKKKEMYYNNAERIQMDRLRSVLSSEGFKNVQNRLADSGLRRGISCLFYGAPGTGKTESVLQLARETGRDIMQIDIAGLRDKYVGESEKNIKSVFSRYKEICKSCEVTPILFFNEADAIINSRLESTHSSVEKMDNAMQNIILQELENLDGILIATTNLTGNLDKAFDRRFLFKVEFLKPGLKAKQHIWHSILPEFSEGDCQCLAAEFDFSGGQIENIARKCNIEYILSGEKPSIDRVREYCQEEYLNRNNRAKIGF